MKMAMPEQASAEYAFPVKALTRWSRDLLTIEHAEDGAARVRFMFNGSTCTGGGIPIQMFFDVELGPADEGYPIRSSGCIPAEKDRGHRAMCEYQMRRDKFMREIEAYKPLLDHSLDEALRWQPDVLPAGCLCMRSTLDHKWLMVLQTVHFALHKTS